MDAAPHRRWGLRSTVVGGMVALLVGLTVALLHPVADASAQVLTVTGLGDAAGSCSAGSCTTLRAAVGAANLLASSAASPVEIDLPSGTITLTNGALTLGSAANTFTLIKGASPVPGSSAIVQATPAAGVFVTPVLPGITTNFQDLTISGGDAQVFGGGALQTGANGDAATFTDCRLVGNAGSSGGAIVMNPAGDLTIVGSTFTGNHATAGAGGAIQFDNLDGGGTLAITGSSFSDNTAVAAPGGGVPGGAVYFEGATLTVTSSTFDANTAGSALGAEGQGGAIWADGESAGSISLSQFTRNQAIDGAPALNPDTRGIGGAIFNQTGDLTVSRSRFAGNGASQGAAIEESGSGSVSAVDNWWGSNSGPGSAVSGDSMVASSATPATSPWLQLRAGASPGQIAPGATATLTADLLGQSGGGPLPAGSLDGLPTFPAATATVFSGATNGTLAADPAAFVNGVATSGFTGGTTLGSAGSQVTADSQTLPVTLQIVAGSATALSSSVNPSVVGQGVQFTATLSSASPGSTPPAPTDGTVQFFIDGSPFGSPAPVATGTAQSDVDTGLAPATHTVTATYSGGSGFSASTATLAGGQVVHRADTTTTVGTSGNPAGVGDAVTFSATVTVTAPGAAAPGGTVQFKDNGVPIGAPQPVDSSGVATLATSALAPGSHTVTAAFSGDPLLNGSSGQLSPDEVIERAPTVVTLGSTASPSVTGQTVTFTATVTSTFTGTPNETPGGTVQFAVDGSLLGAPVPLSGGSASSTPLGTLAVGAHTVTATYSGDTTYAPGTGTLAGGQAVNRAGTVITVGTAPDPSLVGEGVTFSATVTVTAPGAGTPTGAVRFAVDGADVGSPVAVNGGLATLPGLTSLTLGSHSVTATYLGDPGFLASTSAPVTQVVNGFPTTTTVTSTANPSVFGQPVAFAAQVDAGAHGTPPGSVQFTIDGAPAGGPLPLTGGVAALPPTAALAVGTHTVTATYLGAPSFGPSTGQLAGGQVVDQASVAGILSSSTNPSVFGQPVTFTLTVSPMAPGAGSPSGSVQFGVDGTNMGAPVPLASGSAAVTLDALSVGTHIVTATYSGDASFAAAGATLSGGQGVARAGSATAVSASVNPSVAGQPVTFTVTVTAVAPGSGTPTGTVQVFVDRALVEQDALVGGVATTAPLATLTVGSHVITAAYAGNDDFSASSSPNVGQTVNRAASVTTVSPAASPSVFGQAVTFTAVVAPAPPGSGQPGGVVTFFADGVGFGSAALSGSTAVSPPLATLAAGTHAVTATFGGNATFAPSTGGTSQIVNPAGTAVSMTSEPDPSVFGEAVTFSATVTAVAPGAGIPTGTVQFLADGTPLGAPVGLVGGSASVTGTALLVGDHVISAHYAGSADFAASDATTAQHVDPAGTTVSVASSASPSVFGQAVSFTATVTPVAPGAGTPSGTVQFFVDGGPSGAPVALAGGSAGASAGLAPIASLAVGRHTVTATYGGDLSFAPGSGTLAGGQMVDRAGTSTTVTSSVNPSVTGQGVTLSAAVAVVAPGAGSPTGSVEFFVDGTSAGTATVTSGSAELPAIATLAVGTHPVTATYSGDASFSASTSATFSQEVDKAGSATALTSARSPTVFGQPVTFTATVAAAGAGSGQPTGSVDFFADGVAFGTSPLAGQVAVSPPIASLAAGSHTVTATYRGDGSFAASTGSATQVVDAAATTVALTAAPNPARYGQPITFSATVTAVPPGAGTPTGNVQFLANGAALGAPVALAHGVATLQEGALPAGTYSVDATYLGDANFSGSTDPVVIQIQPADTATTVTSTVNPSAFGEAVSFAAKVAPLPPGSGTPTGTVQFFLDGSAFGTPAPLAGGVGTSAATTSLAVGTHAVTATYAGTDNDNPSTSAAFAQVVSRLAPGMSVTSSVTPSAFGQPVTFTAQVTGTDGTPTGTVQFGVDGANLGTPVPLVGGIGTSDALTTLATGDHAVTATYSGNAVYLPATGSVTQTVARADTTTGVTSSDNPSVFGAEVHFTATVAAVAPGGGTPVGSVQFVVDGSNLGAPVDLGGGQAGQAVSPPAGGLEVGNHSVSALYLGGANFSPSSAPLAGGQTVTRSPTGLDVASSANPSAFGQRVAFTATVRATGGGAGTPDGTVQFSLDGAPLGGPVSLSGGVAGTGTISSLAAGQHAVSAQYSGSGDYLGSTGSLSGGQQVGRAATTTNLGSSENPSVAGDAVTFRATIAPVAPGAGVPTGAVQFTIDGAAAGGPVPMSGGVAAYTTGDLGPGVHIVAAAYPGDAGFSPSTGTLSGGQTVASRDMADLSLGIFGPHRAVAGLPLTYGVLVVNTGPATATGVQLTDHLPGGVGLGPVAPGQGSCTAAGDVVTCSLGSLPAGEHTLVHITVTPGSGRAAGTLTDSASVSADQPDPNPAYNTAQLMTAVRGAGYWLLASDGGVFSFGGAAFHGSTGGMVLNRPVVGMVPAPDGGGYWLVASDGGVFAFGDAGFYGSTGSLHLNAPIVGMAATADGAGYWLVASDGGIFAFGDAGFYGSTGGRSIAGHVVGMATTPDGAGYWLVGSDGTVYAFGDAQSFGSAGGGHAAIVGMAATADGAGYWLVGSDGTVSPFGDAGALGSLAGIHLAAPIVGIAATSDGAGYWLVGSDGGVFAFGDAPFLGSMGGQHLNKPVIGISASG
ncbi:MAG TPA: Ig-like domain repeat protein [Actinomycetota bacterium]|nr:Ig-like domain repeat protein [Actinomycetota bacterium]